MTQRGTARPKSVRELRELHPEIRSLSDVLRRHPDFDPRAGRLDDAPTTDEIHAANCMTQAEYDAAWEAHRLERDAEAAGRELADVEAEAARLRERTEAAGVPARYRSVALDLTHLGTLQGGGNLWVHGARGSGKTQLASATLRGWLSRNPHGQPLFVTAPDLITEIDATYGGGGSEAGVIDRYGLCPLLVVDDLGKENPTPHALSKLWQVIDRRSGAMLPTIVTSQYNAGDAIAVLGRLGDHATAEAIVSRLMQGCRDVFTGTVDRRLGGRSR